MERFYGFMLLQVPELTTGARPTIMAKIISIRPCQRFLGPYDRTTTTATKTPQINGLTEQRQTRVLLFGRFLCHPRPDNDANSLILRSCGERENLTKYF